MDDLRKDYHGNDTEPGGHPIYGWPIAGQCYKCPVRTTCEAVEHGDKPAVCLEGPEPDDDGVVDDFDLDLM